MTKKLRDLLAARAAEQGIMEDIADRLKSEHRDFTPDEQSAWDGAKAKRQQLDADIKKLTKEEEEEEERMNKAGRPLHGSDDSSAEVRCLTKEQRISDLYQASNEDKLNFGKYMRGIVTGHWDNAAGERRAMAEGALGTGGYVVPTPLSTRIIDKARNMARVMQAGALTIPMTSSTLRMGRVATDPEAHWKAENAPIVPSDMDFEPVTFTAHTLVALCKLSVELFEDGVGLDKTLEDALASSLALALDKGALYGTGLADDPTGLAFAQGVQVYSMGDNGAALNGYEPFSYAVQAIRDANGEPNAVLLAPRSVGDLDRTLDGNGLPQTPYPSWVNLAKYITKQIPVDEVHGAAVNASSAFVGDYTKLMVGMRTNVNIEVSRQAADAEGSAFGNLQVWVRAYLRADVQLAQPSHFCRIAGILPVEPIVTP